MKNRIRFAITLAGAILCGLPTTGNNFVAFHYAFRLDQSGVVTRIVGNARPGYSGDGRPASNTQPPM